MKHLRTAAILIAVAILIVAALSPLAPLPAIVLTSLLVLPVTLALTWRTSAEPSTRARTRPTDPFHLRAPPLRLSA